MTEPAPVAPAPDPPRAEVERDARTTPRWLRLPALGLLGLVATWFLLSYSFALGAPKPEWARPHPWVWWFASWEMFTLRDPGAHLVKGKALYDGKWVDIDLEALFPTKWESGPRYARSAFFKNPPSMRVVADSTCGRLERRPDRVRFEHVYWDKTLGQPSRVPPKDAKRNLLLDHRCGSPVRRPQGVRL